MRSSAAASLLLLAAALVCGCYHNQVKSNGPAFAFSGSTAASQSPTSAISANPPEPGTSNSVTFTFTLLNYTGNTLPPLYFQVHLDALTGPVVASGYTPQVAAFGTSAVVSAVVSAPAGGGTHTFFVYVDSANNLNQRTVASNIELVTITFADFDLAFSAAPSVAPASPTTLTPLTISFAVVNNDTSGNAATASGVGYQVLEYGLPIASGTIPSIAANNSVGVATLIPAPTAGLHEYTVVINPGELIPEQNFTNNSLSVAIAVPVPN